VRALDDGSFVFTIDPDPESPGAFGDHIPYTEALYNASLGTPGVDKEAYVDQWGRFYSAYSPVFDSNGNVTDIVAVDFTADWVDRQFSNQFKAIVSISGISVLVASIIIILIANRYKKRFDRLFQGVNMASEGIETLVREISPDAEPVEQTMKTTRNADEIDMMNERIFSLQEKLSKQIQLVRSRAYIDGLTGLNNRAAYEEHAARLEDAIRGGTANFAIALFDVNSLKEVNDKYGHKKGDEVIHSAAVALQNTFREGKLYRIGGDEFLVILERSYAVLPQKLAFLQGNLGGFSISAGSTVYDRGTDRDYRSVFNRADMAMYNDKREYYLIHGDRRRAPLNGYDEPVENKTGE
jgi:diguanylate cyclase (GGDEF)-like protein